MRFTRRALRARRVGTQLTESKERIMLTSTSLGIGANVGTVKIIIPVIRVATTLAFAIVPASLGFMIIGVAEQVISWMMSQR
jgi:hypothetical protein